MAQILCLFFSLHSGRHLPLLYLWLTIIAEDDQQRGVKPKEDEIVGDRLPDGIYEGRYRGYLAKLVVSDSSNSYRMDIYWGGLFKPDGIGHNHVASVGQELRALIENGKVIVGGPNR